MAFRRDQGRYDNVIAVKGNGCKKIRMLEKAQEDEKKEKEQKEKKERMMAEVREKLMIEMKLRQELEQEKK